MPYNKHLADRVREYLSQYAVLQIEEREMFRGLTFMINGKMCVSVSGQSLMCRFNPAIQHEVGQKPGFRPMVMKGREMDGYGYVDATGFESEKDFKYWLEICLAFNDKAKASSKRKK